MNTHTCIYALHVSSFSNMSHDYKKRKEMWWRHLFFDRSSPRFFFSLRLFHLDLILAGRDLAPSTLTRHILNHKVTFSAGVPTIWLGVLDELTRTVESKLCTNTQAHKQVQAHTNESPSAPKNNEIMLGVLLFSSFLFSAAGQSGAAAISIRWLRLSAISL